jgi:hypothetical protein
VDSSSATRVKARAPADTGHHGTNVLGGLHPWFDPGEYRGQRGHQLLGVPLYPRGLYDEGSIIPAQLTNGGCRTSKIMLIDNGRPPAHGHLEA